MAVIGTPVAAPSDSSSLTPLIVATPATTRIYCKEARGKMPGVAIRQTQRVELALSLRDDIGNPLDLTAYGFPLTPNSTHTVVAKLQEAVGDGFTHTSTATILDPLTGSVKFVVPKNIITVSGVYIGEVGALDSNALITSTTFYLLVERGFFTISGTQGSSNCGLPSIQEIRTHLRDFPEANRLTDEYEFDIAEICDALTRCINYWNATPPLIDALYLTTTFPYRHQWLEGACSYLFETAATYFRRANLQYQAGGLSVDDLNKEKEYLQAAMMKRQSWESFVKMRKAQHNMEQCFATFGSPYGDGW